MEEAERKEETEVEKKKIRKKRRKIKLDVSSKNKTKYALKSKDRVTANIQTSVQNKGKNSAQPNGSAIAVTVPKTSATTQCNLWHGIPYEKAAQTDEIKWKKFVNEQLEKCSARDVGTQTADIYHDEEALNTGKKFLMDENNVNEILMRLHDKGQVADFLVLLNTLRTGLLPMDNLAWLCLLDRAKYAGCKSTTLMKYRNETMEFWSTVYLLFGNSALSVFRGSTHFGKVVTEQCRRGQYDPQEGKCNFSVPSVPTLRKVKTGFSRAFDPGFIEPTLAMAEERSAKGRQFTLALDGKKIAEGVKGLRDGDVDLMGCERPNLESELTSLNEQMKFAQSLIDMETIDNVDLHIFRLKRAVHKISIVISKLQRSITSKTFAQNRMRASNAGNKKGEKRTDYSISLLNVRKHECDINLNRALSLVGRLLNLLAICSGMQQSYSDTGFFTLSKSPLASILLPVEILEEYFKMDMVTKPLQVKQGSDLWFAMRKVARVTGSTMYRALGLENFDLMKKHIQTYVKGIPRVYKEDVKAMFEYGKKNEVNAAATIVGRLCPAWFPICCRYMQVGMQFLGPPERMTLLEVSADGIIRCENEGLHDCPYKQLHLGDGIIPVELKCAYPQRNLPHMPYEELPVRYVTQCLAEMAAFESEILIFGCWTPSSTAVFLVHFDAQLWSDLMDLTVSLYAAEECNAPKKWPSTSKALIPRLKEFVKSHSRLMCIIPSVRGEEGDLLAPVSDSCYAQPPDMELVFSSEEYVLQLTEACGQEAKDVFSKSYNSLREPAAEVLLWMLSCKDRMQERDVPNSVPLCYHLKGRNFSMPTARSLIEKVRDKLKERNIDILCENYDGQFQSVIVKSKNGAPLTKIQLQKKVWSSVFDKSKDHIIGQILATNSLTTGDLDILTVLSCISPGTSHFTNLTVEKKLNPKKITLSTRGGPMFRQSVAAELKYAPLSQDEIRRFKVNQPKRKQQTKQYGLQENETNLLNAIHPELLEEVEVEVDSDMWNDLGEDELPDLEDRVNPLREVLSNDNFHLLQDILQALRDFSDKWNSKTIHDLYPETLQNPAKLNKAVTKPELQVIAQVLAAYTQNRAWYQSSESKCYNVNMMAKAFESTVVLAETLKRKKKHSPPTLLTLCRKKLMNSSYPSLSLKVSYARVLHKEMYVKWCEDSTVPMTWQIPFRDDPMHLFSYPEYSQERRQIEFRSFDPVHILTKVRGHLIKNGYTFTSKEAFRQVATRRPDILSRSIVFDSIDPQNAFIAERVIGEPVEEQLRLMGFNSTADFVSLFRFFFRATNERGMSADERVCWLYEMHQFLLKDTAFDEYPPKYTQYVKGMPIQTFEAILQLCSTRIPLYTFAKGKTYNVRSCTTLPCESAFSDLTRLDREGHLYPKACNVRKLLGRSVSINYIKHNPSKSYEICTTNKGAYPVHLAEDDRERWETETDDNFDGMFKDHFFDYVNERPSKRVRRSDVSTGMNSMRNVQGVRQWFRNDESKLDPMHRSVLPVNN